MEKRTEKIEQLEKENSELIKLMQHLKMETEELKKRIELLEKPEHSLRVDTYKTSILVN